MRRRRGTATTDATTTGTNETGKNDAPRATRARGGGARRRRHRLPPLLLAPILYVGTDAGTTATVRVFADTDRDGAYETLVQEITPFGTAKAGVRVATGDFDGDGNSEVVLAMGKGSRRDGGSRVDVYDVNGDGSIDARIDSFQPFGSRYTRGVHVATGDLDGDGRD